MAQQQKILFTTKEQTDLQPHVPDAGINGKYKLFIINRPSDHTYIMPLLWASAKTFYETNGKHKDKWHWANPKVNYDDPYELAEFIAGEKPTIVGFSQYVWNEEWQNTCAKRLRELDPDVYIVFGGPHSDIEWNDQVFKQIPYIDFVSPNDAYGEIALKDLLDNVANNDGKVNVEKDLPYLYYTNENRECFNNGSPPNKREFVWPPNPFRAQEKYLIPFIEHAHAHGHWVRLTLETSRGCPYKCSFCDWGGGTFRKTNKKPMQIVKDEITWCGENQIDMISVADANFGMFEVDIEYAKFIGDTARKYEWPRVVHLNGPTKVKQHNLKEIYEHLTDADLLTAYQISIQDVSDEIKKNVDRVDFPFEDQVDMFLELQKRKYLPIFIETIMGLPGANIKSIKEEIDIITKHGFQYPLHYIFAMLPGTPANNPEYRKKWNIDTVKNKSSSGFGFPVVYAQKDGYEPDLGINMLDLNTEICTDFVVQTSSYSKEDWIEMSTLMLFTTATLNPDILNPLARYMKEKYGIKPGDLLHEIMKVLRDDDTIGPNIREKFGLIFKQFHDWMYTNKQDLYIDPGPDFSFKLGLVIYTPFAILSHITEFFEAVRIGIEKLVLVDDELSDLIKFSEYRLLDLYNYHRFKSFTVDRDWHAWVTSEKSLEELETGGVTYQMQDTKIFQGGRYFPMDWLEWDGHRRKTEYIYKYLSDNRSPCSSLDLVRINSPEELLSDNSVYDDTIDKPWGNWWEQSLKEPSK